MSYSNFLQIILSYVGHLKVASGKAYPLGLLLEKQAPVDITSLEQEKLDAVLLAGKAVDDEQAQRDEAAGGAGMQPLRAALAAGFGALDMSLEGMANLHTSVTDKALRAEKLRAVILPDGRDWTRWSSVEACMYAKRVLARIHSKKLGKELKDLLGPEYLRTIELVTNDLNEALGLGETARQVPSATAILEALDRFTTALSGYTRALAASVDENDEASCQRFLAAVAPIDDLRSTYGSHPVPAPAPTTNGATPAQLPSTAAPHPAS